MFQVSTLSTMGRGGGTIKRRKTCALLLILIISMCAFPCVFGGKNQVTSIKNVKIGLINDENILKVNAANKVKIKVYYKHWYKFNGKLRFVWKYYWKYKSTNTVKPLKTTKVTTKEVEIPCASINAACIDNSTNSTTNQICSNNTKSTKIVRQVYITSDNIISKTCDTNRINAIIKGLKAKGISAVNCGVDPNKHISVLKSNIPSNALVVDIYGGACAGTIYEMGKSYYKAWVGTKKVFSVWLPTAKNITGLAWLPRAHDDNFDPASFKGLAHPDKYLLKNGYNYIYSGNLNSIIASIYKEATT